MSPATLSLHQPTTLTLGLVLLSAACNIAGVLLSEELKEAGIAVGLLHPGFNRTDMTKRYEHIWDIEGAVDSSVGAKRVIHEVGKLSLDTTGQFINCEDGLPIPW